jgi:hypothetical protein
MNRWDGYTELYHSQAQYQKQLNAEKYRNKYSSPTVGKSDGSQSRGAYIRREQKARMTLDQQKKRLKEKADEVERKIKERGRRIRLSQKAAREYEARTQQAVSQQRMGRSAAGYNPAKRGHIATANIPKRMTAQQAYDEILNKIAAANYIGNIAVLGLAGGPEFDKACSELDNFICTQCDEYMANYGLSYEDAVAVAKKLMDVCGEQIGLMIVGMQASQMPQGTVDPVTGLYW